MKKIITGSEFRAFNADMEQVLETKAPAVAAGLVAAYTGLTEKLGKRVLVRFLGNRKLIAATRAVIDGYVEFAEGATEALTETAEAIEASFSDDERSLMATLDQLDSERVEKQAERNKEMSQLDNQKAKEEAELLSSHTLARVRESLERLERYMTAEPALVDMGYGRKYTATDPLAAAEVRASFREADELIAKLDTVWSRDAFIASVKRREKLAESWEARQVASVKASKESSASYADAE